MFTKEEIEKKRSYIRKCMVKDGTTTDLRGKEINLEYLGELYDRYFFAGKIQKRLRLTKSKLDYVISKHTKTGGSCSKKGDEYTIKIPINLFRNLFQKGEKTLKVNGLLCTTHLECLQIVLEHELIHLFMFLYYHDSKPSQSQSTDTFSPHGEMFRSITYMYFGHTDHKHSLLNGDASTKINRDEAKIGMRVKYQSSDGNEYHGVISKINPKKAIVKNDDGKIFGVPYEMLENSDKSVPETYPLPDIRGFTIPTKKDILFVGERIAFSHKGETQYGTITRKNLKRATVEVDDDGKEMLVPYDLLERTDKPRPLASNIKRNIKNDLKVGDIISVRFKSEIKKGKIIKLNPSKARVEMDDKSMWNVPYQNIIGKV